VYTVTATSPCFGSDQATVNVTVVPMQAMVMEMTMSDDGMSPAWEIRRTGDNALMHAQEPEFMPGGSPFEFAPPYYNIELPPGNYHLYFPDGLNGVASYVLRTVATSNDALYPNGRRFVDSNAPINTASPVQVADHGTSNGTIQLPMSDDRVLQLSCDKYWWKAGDYLVCNEDPAVAAIWNNGNAVQQGNTGYDFWFYDPNGTYSYVRSRRHNQTDGYGNVGSTRTCHMRVNSTYHGWNAADYIPDELPLNVRVRAVVNGVPGPWGPACRFMRSETMAACPPTTLWKTPVDDIKYSCDDSQRNWNNQNSQRLYAHPVSGATQYRFRFYNLSEGYDFTRVNSTYYVNLGWTAAVGPALTPGSVYDVTVQAYKGGTFGPNGDGWCAVGDPCQVLICNAQGVCSGMTGGGQNSAVEATDGTAVLGLWPNPNRGDLLHISFSGLEVEAGTLTMDIVDLSGKRVGSHTLPVQEGTVNTVVELHGDLAAGMYTVRIMAGDRLFTERLVIQP
jgi:hypothetical protein